MSKFCFDTHMHFDLYQDRDSVINYLEHAKSYTIAVTNLPDLFEKYINYYGTYKYVKFALGFHPELAFQYSNQINKFKRNVANTRYIGEIGLDFNTSDLNNKKKQLEIFGQIVEVCNTYDDKIMTIHSRSAEKEVLSVLEPNKSKIILHWYSGGIRELQEAVGRGYYFSINQQMIRSNNGKKIINSIPLDRILLESDAPFTKGLEKHYSISFMEDIYKFLSETRNMEIDEVSVILKNNFRIVLS